jgi:hypothetical protein
MARYRHEPAPQTTQEAQPRRQGAAVGRTSLLGLARSRAQIGTGSPLFRPKVFANPNAYKRRKKFNRNPADNASGERIN